jgi:hypothetical protein
MIHHRLLTRVKRAVGLLQPLYCEDRLSLDRVRKSNAAIDGMKAHIICVFTPYDDRAGAAVPLGTALLCTSQPKILAQ